MLKESDVSVLINHSGRLRMLSHRSAMFITVLSEQTSTDPWFNDELAVTIKKFEHDYKLLIDTLAQDENTNTRFLKFKDSTQVHDQSIDNIIQHFLSELHKLNTAVRYKKSIPNDTLVTFIKFVSSSLLLALNEIVAFFEALLLDIANSKLKRINTLGADIEESLSEVDKINLSIKILSFNASVEAARAGEMGAGFKVVANEMNRLNMMTRDVTQGVNASVNTFIKEINN
ncbi:methyl-accepting chemotaxis protein [Algibacillus agarilyticus]|uniref:methyl-accepting chemotaxis protein n=1 Tax=Algibacillus agarilyticus TaxID=2234133 RepID=UPI0013009E77|nr:methyl-accepting chemotaxis protein [Algibacillus agarilyticus]